MGATSGPAPSAASTTACTCGSRGSWLWAVVAPGHRSCSRTFVAPASRAESGGVTVSSTAVHSDSQAGPAGVSSPRLSPSSSGLPGTSCRQAAGQIAGD